MLLLYNSVNDDIILARDAFGETTYYLIQNKLYFFIYIRSIKKLKYKTEHKSLTLSPEGIYLIQTIYKMSQS